MAPNRKQHRNILRAAVLGNSKIPSYQTLRRWRLKGKLNEVNLQRRGVLINWRTHPCQGSQVPAGSTSGDSDSQLPLEEYQQMSFPVAEPMAQSSSVNSFDGNCSESSHCSNSTSDSFSDDLPSSHSSFIESSDNEDEEEEARLNLAKILKSKFIGPDVLNELLHPNLRVTKFETMLMIMHLSTKHGMSGVFLKDLLEFVNQIVGIPDALQSKHLFEKLFTFGSKSTIHFYCPNCSEYLGCEKSFRSGIVSCAGCEWVSNVSSHNDDYYFMSLSLREQIREVLSRPGTKFVSKDRLDNIVADIMDGKMYKVLSKEGNILSNPNALTLTFNTDGSPVFKSGPNSLWPIHFFINEIELPQRYKADNILLGGLWFGHSEPNIQLFLKPFVEELKELEKRGVVWSKPDGTFVESPIYAICCCTDSAAKPKVQCHHQHNGAYSCGYCLHPNTSITVLEKIQNQSGLVLDRENFDGSSDDDNGPQVVYRRKKLIRFVRGDYKLRTNKELREHMKLAAATEVYDHIMGSTGVSVLCELKYFNVVFGFGIDYLHNVLLGTVKRLAGYWFDSTSKGAPYYIGLSIGRVDERLESITLPMGFRPPRPMSDRVHWKANEWRAFMLYFALPVLANILPTPYYNHFKKFVTAIYILSKETILYDEVDDAHSLLQAFVYEYQDLYEEINMVYNTHLNSHLAQVVSKVGPLWAYSAFPFESANGRVVKLVKGTRGVCTQISRKYIMTKSIPTLLMNNYKAKDEILDFCCKLFGYNYLKNFSKGKNDETMLGRQSYYSLHDRQKQAFVDQNLPVPQSVLTVTRVIVQGKLYHGRMTTRQLKACDSCVRLKSGEFAVIDLIICNQSDGDVIFLVTKLNVATDPSPFLVSHIKQCSLNTFGEPALIKSDEISRKCIFYSCTDRYFVAEISNFYETD